MAATPDFEALYNSMSTRGVVTLPGSGLRVHHSSLCGSKRANEDRIAVHECELGAMVAVFDGHYSAELSDHAAKVLPRFLCDRISHIISKRHCDLSSAVEEALQQGIRDFDVSLIDAVYGLFPQGAETDWHDEHWDDPYYVYEIIGREVDDERYCKARHANVGTTALIAFISQAKDTVWVASLGDSEGVLGRSADGRISSIPLNELHNAKNPQEVARVEAEHPGEPPIFYDGRTMRQLTVTRALGDYQMKASFRFGLRILRRATPACVVGAMFEFWKGRGLEHYHPPYISNTPSVRRYSLLPGDLIVLASDGLRGALENQGVDSDELPSMVIALASDSGLSAAAETLRRHLGHDLLKHGDGDNAADHVVRNVLFGADNAKAAAMLSERGDDCSKYRDDISVALIRLE